ncbi:hypothetical protein QOZ80_1BG0070870 [Eleusine coracana subsp. coracana]|nr:hypothetical protein QOZ80_1BG0070870 [Eleusine coracana subsp. coracana]
MARGETPAAASKKKKKSTTTNEKKKASSSSRAPPPRDVVPIDRVLAANAALRGALAALGLGATTRPLPQYVISKQLRTSDVHRNQARLLFSCKSGPMAQCPLAACFTAHEARRVADKGAGLLVTALDRGGRRYDLTCKYLASNHAYRFITGWKAFLETNGLALVSDGFRRDVVVELWAFRSPALPNRVVVDVGNNNEKVKVYEETGHPDGALGLVLLHYENTSVVEEDHEEAGTMLLPPPVVTPQEDLLRLIAGTAATEIEQRDARAMMTKDEIVAKFGEEMANAAIGMEMLRRDRGYMVDPSLP